MRRLTSAPIAGALATISGCTTPADVSRPLTEVADKNAMFELKDTATGFTIALRYSRYQFFPEAGALLVACRALVTVKAYNEVKRRGCEIEPINEQSIRVSTGRNIIKSRTAGRAFAEARFK